MKYTAILLALALATFTSALPQPTRVPEGSWGPSQDKSNALMEKRHGGPPHGGPPDGGPHHGPPGDGGPDHWQHQQQQQKQQQQQQDYSNSGTSESDQQEEEDNIVLSHLNGNTKE